MNFSVQSILPFEKQLKRLSKKYPSLKKDILLLIEELEINPVKGTPLGNNFYKVRMAITSKGKGKSGGARIITLVKVSKEKVYLASIYDKNEQADISDKELKWLAEIISKA